MHVMLAWVVRLLIVAVTVRADVAMAAPPDCADADDSTLAEAFEQWWLHGRLHEDGAALCLQRLHVLDGGDSPANVLRQARRSSAQGRIDEALRQTTALAVRAGLDRTDSADAALTLGELLLAQERLAEAGRYLADDGHERATDRYRHLRRLLARTRLHILQRDAEPCLALARTALAFAEARFGPDDSATAMALLGLGSCQRLNGDHGGSIASLQRASSIERGHGGNANHQIVAQALVSEAQGHKIAGDYARAARTYEEALSYLRAHPEPVPFHLSALLHGMANLDRDDGRAEASLARYDEAVAVIGQAYGENSQRVSQALNNQGNALGILGRYDDAIDVYDRALAVAATRGGDADPTILMPIANKALVRLWQKRYEEAESGFREGIRIAEGTPAGAENSTLFPRLGLAASLWGQGRHAHAYAEAERAERERQLALDRALPTMSEAVAIRFQEILRPGLDLAVVIANDSGDAELVARAWALAMSARGQVADGIAIRLALMHASDNAAVRRLVAHWQRANTRLGKLRSLDPTTRGEALIAAEQAVDDAGQALASVLPEGGLPTYRAHSAPADVLMRPATPGATLVGFTSALLRSPDEYAHPIASKRPRDVYAFVGQAGAAPRLLRLADEDTIAATVAGWRATVGDPRTTPTRHRRAGLRVRRLLFDPLAIASDSLVFTVPYGSLHQLNLAALPDGDGFLIERGLRVHTLNHERELLREPMPRPEVLNVLAVSDPDIPHRNSTENSSAREQPCGMTNWPRLPGTRREVDSIRRSLPPSSRLTDLHGAQATRSTVLEALQNRDIIHLATHGMRLEDGCRDAGAPVARGATLAALDATPAAGTGNGVLVLGREPGQDRASYLSDTDLAGLALHQARWVVLSACDTALAESRTYEGAFGLRRAFQLAGARTVIMSLWRIDDTATADWMAALYRARLEQGADTPTAMHRAQIAMLEARRDAGLDDHPYYWAGFIAAGDWH